MSAYEDEEAVMFALIIGGVLNLAAFAILAVAQ